jgi:hypothetical protein
LAVYLKEDAMRHLRFVVLAVVAVALCAAPVAVAHPPHGDGGAVVTPAHKVAGLSGDELLGEAWVQLLSVPAGTFAGSCTPVTHKVVSPEPDADGNASCTIKKGTSLFIPVGSDCSNVEPEPFFGADEEAQRECAVAVDEFFVAISIAVDGGEPLDIRNPRFELLSPQRSVVLPEDNFLGVPAGPATFVAHGWAALVKKLRPGEHTITVVVTDSEGVTTTGNIFVEVVSRGHNHDDHGHHGDDRHYGDD